MQMEFKNRKGFKVAPDRHGYSTKYNTTVTLPSTAQGSGRSSLSSSGIALLEAVKHTSMMTSHAGLDIWGMVR